MIQDIEIKKLKLLDRNPRKITKEQMIKLEKSIEEDPFFLHLRPVLVRQDQDGTLEVYAGNQRVRAAKKLKWKTIPCIIEDTNQLSDETMRKRVILDNVSMGEFDYDILACDYDPSELFELGFTKSDLDIFEEIKSDSLPKPDESQIIEDETEESNDLVMCPSCKFEFHPT